MSWLMSDLSESGKYAKCVSKSDKIFEGLEFLKLHSNCQQAHPHWVDKGHALCDGESGDRYNSGRRTGTLLMVNICFEHADVMHIGFLFSVRPVDEAVSFAKPTVNHVWT